MKSKILLRNGQVLLADNHFARTDILIGDGLVQEIGASPDPVLLQRGDEQWMQRDASVTPSGLRRGLSDVLVADLERTLSDLDARLFGVEVDEAPTKPGQLAWSEAAHETGEPHRWTAVDRDCIDE